MVKLVLQIIFACVFIFLGGCKTSNQKQTVANSSSRTDVPMTEKEQLEFDFLFFEALKDKQLGNFKQAQTRLQQAIRINPKNATAHYELSQIYLQNGSLDQSLIAAQNAVKFDSKNNWFKMALAELYERAGNFDKMIPLLNDLIKAYPENYEYQYALAGVYGQTEKFSEAIAIFDKIEKKIGVNQELAIQKMQLFESIGKPEKAIEEINKLIKAFPEEAEYYGYLAEIHINNKQPDLALKAYQELLKKDPENPRIHFLLAEYYRTQGQKEKSFEELQLAFKQINTPVDAKIQVLGSYFELVNQFPELKEQSKILCEILVTTHPEETKAHAVYGDFLYQDGKLDEAEREYRKVLTLDKSSFNVWSQLLVLVNEKGDFVGMLELSKEAIELFPNQPTFYLFKGIASQQLKQYEESVLAFKEGANLTVENPTLSAQFYASLGDSYNYLSNYSESNAAYEKALSFDEKNVYVLNNYAYYLSLRKQNLDRAKELALKCNNLQPGNPSYEDTYAWVLYQSGDYASADIWIDKAIKNGGIKSATILEHKGDILWKLGKATDALDFWKRAKEIGGASDKIEQKINQQKLIE
jgi:tetratricopeptide (TPR) repeat protein